MRTLFAVATASLLLTSMQAYAQRGPMRAAPPRPGLECFDQMTTPVYPQVAMHGLVTGTVWTTIHLNPQAMVDKVDTQVVSAYSAGTNELAPAVEKAVRASKFKSSCAGKNVFVAFRYEMDGQAVPNPHVMAKKDPPNVVWIESRPPAMMAKSSSSKARH
jgi:hypothetical protein